MPRNSAPSKEAWEGLASDFGEPILAAEVRESADAAWQRLREQVQRLGGPKRLPEPDAAFTAALREKVERAFQQIRQVEV